MPCYQCSKCGKCGMLSTRADIVCKTCGKPIAPGESTCSHCGASTLGNTEGINFVFGGNSLSQGTIVEQLKR